MIKEWATVVSWQDGIALVSCDVKASCNSCASRAGCGSRVLNKLGPQTSHTISVPSEQPLMAGQKVELGIAEGSLLSSAMLVYLSPLVGLFIMGGLWASGALYGKLASVFSSTGTGGGQEQTITSTWTTLAHHGMVIVPIGYGAQELFDISQVRGGTPYGATTIAGGDGSRQPSNEELAIARYQGEYVAGLAKKLNG